MYCLVAPECTPSRHRFLTLQKILKFPRGGPKSGKGVPLKLATVQVIRQNIATDSMLKHAADFNFKMCETTKPVWTVGL